MYLGEIESFEGTRLKGIDNENEDILDKALKKKYILLKKNLKNH